MSHRPSEPAHYIEDCLIFRHEMMVRGLFGHCAFMASRSDLIAGPQGWFLRFCSLACAAKRVNSPYFVQKLIDIKKSGQIA